MNQSKVSVIIVTYNAAISVAAAIDSVLQQTRQHTELVIIDGKSTDNTVQIIESYGTKINYFISEKDNGIYDAMNKGIAAATGEWVLFLGADDILYNATVLEEVFEKADLSGVDFLYGDAEFSSSKRRYGGERNYQQLIEQNICHQAIFYRRSLFEKAGTYNLRYSILADYELNLRIFRQPTFITRYIPVIITLFNDRGTSNTTIDRNFHGDMLQHFLAKDALPFFSPLLQQYHFYYGYVQLSSKRILHGIRHILTSWIRGKRKLFFFLLTGKFVFTNLVFKSVKIR